MAGSLPQTYKAAVLEKAGQPIVVKDVPLKKPGRGQVLVKIIACGVCHTDIFEQHGFLGDVFPRTPGHELVGDVVAVGENVTRFSGCERVGGPWHGGESSTYIEYSNYQTFTADMPNRPRPHLSVMRAGAVPDL